MKLKINIHEFIEQNASTYNGRLQVSAAIDLQELFCSIPEEDEIDVDLRGLLAEQRQIAIVWSVEDVQEVRPDLNADQAWEVLQQVRHGHDATIGINWDVLSCHAQMLFGAAPDTEEEEEDRP